MSAKTRGYKLLLSAGVCAAALLTAVPGARADLIGTFNCPTSNTCTSSLNVGNDAISGYTGPYGTVGITLTRPTTANITFTAASGFLFGDGGSFDLNVNATSFSGSGYTFTQLAGFNAASLVNGPASGNVDGLGTFNATHDLHDGFASAITGVSFTLTNTEIGGTWADASDVLIANNKDFDAAAHIFVCNDPACSKDAGAKATGFAGEGTVTPIKIPEPSSLAMLGGSLLLAGVVLRRRKQTQED
jgi:PEP-CTERM motif